MSPNGCKPCPGTEHKKGGFRGMFIRTIKKPMDTPLNLPLLGETLN